MIQLRSWRRGLGRGSSATFILDPTHIYILLFKPFRLLVNQSGLLKCLVLSPFLIMDSIMNVDNEIGIFTDELKEPAVNKAPIVLLNTA